MSCLLETALLLVPFVPGGFERLHAAPHVPLKHLPVLALFLPQRHEVTAVVGLILNTNNTDCQFTQQEKWVELM